MWKKIEGFELYSISKEGQVRNDSTGRILKPGSNASGHRYVSLHRKKKYIHRMVAEAFIDNPNNYDCVLHNIPISQGGTDHVDNLRWGNHQQNMLQASTESNMSKTYVNKQKRVQQIDKDTGEVINTFESVSAAGRALTGKYKSDIATVARGNGNRKTALGYKWAYVE